ncbi:MAG: hypothetical protein Q4D41_12780, partial [Prevotellaceae bacterium]|nr:hypothetical protein [Prevotellaceae bacterium]
KRKKVEQKILEYYGSAVSLGNIKALYELGRYKLHGRFYDYNCYPNFSQSVNSDLNEFQKGIEYLQIAAIIGDVKEASVELALACGYETSPIRNPYLCISMLECYYKEFSIPIENLICYMYENGYGIKKDFKQAYIYCPSTKLVNSGNVKTHREEILEKIESLPSNFENSKYGIGLDANMLFSIGFTHYNNDKIDPEGIFWLHRAARQGNADANWALAGILQNGNYIDGTMGDSFSKESQVVYFATKAAELGNTEAKDYLKSYKEYKKQLAERERYIQQQKAEEKRRKRQKWLNVAGAVLQTAAQTYVAVENAKQQNRNYNMSSVPRMSNMQMSDEQWQAKNRLALQQIGQYTVNKYISDWNGTPMVPTDMSAVNLGTDTSPGSPLWMWKQQEQINTVSTILGRMECEKLAFYKRQRMQIEQQLINNQPISGCYDIDGNWISAEMAAAGLFGDNEVTNNTNYNNENTNPYEEIRKKNREYYSERYGNVTCKMCQNSGKCSTCNGKGYNYNPLTTGTNECPNCWRVDGRASGMCGTCRGSGTVYRLR